MPADDQPLPFVSPPTPVRRRRATSDRRALGRARFEALSSEDRAAIWARVDRLLFEEAIWHAARSALYADNPHSWTRRSEWRDDADFVFIVQFLRSGVCDRERYPDAPGGRWYDVLNRHGRKVWVMGWPVNFADGRPWTTIINRKPVLPGDV